MSHVKWGKLKKTRRERERKSERWARHLKQKQRAKMPKRADWNRIMQNDRNWYQDETLNNSNKRRKLSKLQKKKNWIVTSLFYFIILQKVPPSDRCGNGWIYDMSSGNCYKYEMEYRSWQDSDSQCHYEGGRLTSLTNNLETEFVQREYISQSYSPLNYNNSL